jgi:malate synthase
MEATTNLAMEEAIRQTMEATTSLAMEEVTTSLAMEEATTSLAMEEAIRPTTEKTLQTQTTIQDLTLAKKLVPTEQMLCMVRIN